MSPDELGAAISRLVEGAVPEVTFDQLVVTVPVQAWAEAATAVRDDAAVGCTYFDWLSAYDDPDGLDGAGALAVVLHVWSNRHRHHLLLRTHVPRAGGRLASLTGVWAGAAWHERETCEMFGVVFDGHPNLVPLLLPDGFEGHPLRKDFVLASRVAKAWPGAKEPGESDSDVARGGGAPGRRRMLPPGVPAPDEWGPAAAQRGSEGGPA
jgi:NADH-quinone oxidoreductase subunit C